MNVFLKTVLPSIALLILLALSSVYAVIEFDRRVETLERVLPLVERINALSSRLNDLQAARERHLLSYRFDQDASLLVTLQENRADMTSVITALSETIESPEGAALLIGLIDGQEGSLQIEQTLVSAIRSGTDPEIRLVFNRWRLQNDLVRARLADLTVFNTKQLEQILKENEMRRSQAAIVEAALIAAAIGLIVGSFFYYRHTLVRPITNLTHIAARIAAGDLRLKVKELDRRDEIGDLAVSFDRMVSSLIDANERLEERVQARTAELRKLIREIESFSYSVSHDLRTPLRGISGFSQALLEDYADKLDDTGRDYTRRIRAACVRMSALIDDILKLSRVSRSKLTISDVDLSAMALSIANRLRERARDRQIEFDIAPDMVVRGDERMLRIALENLLDNAWKFSSARSKATVEFARTGENGDTSYYVRDNGDGFDMTYVDKLFKPFQRLHTEAEFPGTGIGLATVARVIDRHGGKVWAESELGHGTTVHFTI